MDFYYNHFLTMYPVTGASGGAIRSPWLRIPIQLVRRDPCHSNILKPGKVQWMNDWCFRPRFCTCKAIQGQGKPGLMRWFWVWIMPMVQDWLLDLLISSPVCYHCTMDTRGGTITSGTNTKYCILPLYWFYSTSVCEYVPVCVCACVCVRELFPRRGWWWAYDTPYLFLLNKYLQVHAVLP